MQVWANKHKLRKERTKGTTEGGQNKQTTKARTKVRHEK